MTLLTMFKFRNDKKVPLDKYLICDNGLLHKVVIEDDKPFHALVVLIVFSKYILHQAHDGLGHNGASRTYQCMQ